MMSSKPRRQEPAEAPDPPAALDETTQALIGSQLKAMYAAICEEPIPSQFLDLIKQLEKGKTEK